MIRILVADDSAVAREVVNGGVKVHRARRYIEVDTVNDGRAALDVLQKKPIDIAFVDINMPGLSGAEVVAAMGETRSSKCLTVVMSSALDEASEAVFRRSGAYHFLKKPFHQDDVAELIATYMKMTTSYPILIVDDSATMRKLVRRILEESRFDFEISEADSAPSALRALASGRFRLVLTDFHMPGTDGIELAGSIRDLSSRIGIYMMSTNDASYVERSAAFVGISGFLKKSRSRRRISTRSCTASWSWMRRSSEKVRDMFSFSAREKEDFLRPTFRDLYCRFCRAGFARWLL
ncbi:response regulator [Roseibium salinum]|nr:response regulator [Roseibium salinum]